MTAALALAKKAKLKQVKLNAQDRDDLTNLLVANPGFKKQLDTKVAYEFRDGVALENIEFKGKAVEPLVVLIDPKSRKRHGSLIQWADDGTVVGGFTFQDHADD